jgi:hypothetical protein
MMFLIRIKNKFNPINWIKNFTNIKNQQITLGRWSYENQKKTDLKVDYANEDNCGVCTNLLKKN